LAVVTADSTERQRLLDEGEAIIRSGSGAHGQLYFYRDAIEATLAASDWAEALRYAQALEEYTHEEPLPWSDLFIARARLLAAVGIGQGGDALCRALTDNLAEIDRVGLRPFRARVARALKHLQQGKPTGEVLD